MDQPGLPAAFAYIDSPRALCGNKIRHRVGVLRRKTMGCHPRRLVENQQRRIFVDNGYVKLISARRRFEQPGARPFKSEHIILFQLAALLSQPAIDPEKFFFDRSEEHTSELQSRFGISYA